MDAAPSVESVKVISTIHRARITHSAGLTQVSLRGEGVLVELPPPERVPASWIVLTAPSPMGPSKAAVPAALPVYISI